MTIFDQYAVVTVPFPYVERVALKKRPALLVSVPGLSETRRLAWVLMITSAENEPWPGDIPIDDLVGAGLRTPSVIRPSKIATVETGRLSPIGIVTEPVRRAVRQALGATLGM